MKNNMDAEEHFKRIFTVCTFRQI